MAQDEIVLKLRVEDGELKISTANIDKQSKALDKNTKKKKQGTSAANRSNKAEKALYQTNLSGSKAFSKMNQTMGGSSGLVAAYATLAANVFAATAAFGALQRAAQFSQLRKGLTELGQQSGRTLSIMAEGLREVTGGAISAEEAMRAAALGVSGGFGGEQLSKLAKIARGASITLGRSLPDAFDRLTRGAIKLEPEILDELGIMVRLDDAVENYAAELGKAGGALTQMERRQAFMNAIIEQGTSKFGEIADAVEPDAYSRLGATFSDLTNTIFNFFNQDFVFGFFGLNEVVGFLADNVLVLFGVMTLFASTIAGKMIPALASGAASATQMAEKAAHLAGAANTAKVAHLELMEAALNTSGAEVSDNYAKWSAGLANSKDKMGDLNKMNKSLNASIRFQQGIVATGSKAEKKAALDKIALLKLEQAQLKLTTQAELGRGAAGVAASNATALATAESAVALEIIKLTNKEQKMGATWKAIGAATKAYTADLTLNSIALKSNNRLIVWNAKAMIFLKGQIFKVRKALNLMKISLIELLLPFAALIIAAGILWAVWNWKNNTKEQKKYNKGIEDLKTLTDELEAKVTKYNKALKNSTNIADGQLRSFEIQSGIITELNDKLRETIRLRKEADAGTGRDEKLGMTKAIARSTVVGSARSDSVAEQMGFDASYFASLNDAEDALFKVLRIKDSVEFKTAAEIMKHGIPSQAKALKSKITDIWQDDTIVGQEATLKAIQKAIGEIDAAYGNLGPAAKEIRDSLKETEKEGAKFLSTFAKKTSVDMFARATTTAIKAIDELAKSVKDANADEAGLTLSEVLGKSLMDVGTKTAQMIGPAFVNAQADVRALTKELDVLVKKGVEPTEQSYIDAEKALKKSAIILGDMTPLVKKLNKEVLKTQRLELTKKQILEGINKLTKFATKNYKQIVQLAGLENKLLLKKAKFEKQIAESKIATLRTTFEEIKVTKNGEDDIVTLNELLLMTLEEQQEVVNTSALTQENLYSILGAQFQLSLMQIDVDRKRLKLSYSAAAQKAEAALEELKLRKKILDLDDESQSLAAKKQAYLDRGSSTLLASEEAAIKIQAAETAANFAKDSMAAEMRLNKAKGKMQLIDIKMLNREIALYNDQTKRETKKGEKSLKASGDWIEGINEQQAALDIVKMVDLQNMAIRKKAENLQDAVTIALIQGVEAFRKDLDDNKMGLGEASLGTSKLQRKLEGAFTPEEMSMFGHIEDQSKDTKRLADSNIYTNKQIIKLMEKSNDWLKELRDKIIGNFGSDFKVHLTDDAGIREEIKRLEDTKFMVDGKELVQGSAKIFSKEEKAKGYQEGARGNQAINRTIQIYETILKKRASDAKRDARWEGFWSTIADYAEGKKGGTAVAKDESGYTVKGFETGGKPDVFYRIEQAEMKITEAFKDLMRDGTPIDDGWSSTPSEDWKDAPGMPATAAAAVPQEGDADFVGPPRPESVVPDITELSFNYVNAMNSMKLASIEFQNIIKEFGPEGEAYGAMMEGMIGDEGLIQSLHAFKGVMQGTGDKAEKAISVLSNMGQAVGALGNMMAQNSKMRIAAIDNEIAVEKARDGTSEKSVAKIKALEAKKVAMQKKAFETKKKVAIAETMISVVQSVVQAWKDYGWPWGAVLGAVIAAMGMKQIGIIRSQQFTGGSAGDAGASPAAVNIGKRDKKVDVSKQASAGELAFLRGERGIGTTSTNFVAQGGAAGLRKGYAGGGEILVGERGPETITPLTGLNVLPNQGMKNVVNASFTIHALDAAGVEDVLVGQQGTIINMIRSAANDHGEEFLEIVDTTTYGGTPKSPGGIDY